MVKTFNPYRYGVDPEVRKVATEIGLAPAAETVQAIGALPIEVVAQEISEVVLVQPEGAN